MVTCVVLLIVRGFFFAKVSLNHDVTYARMTGACHGGHGRDVAGTLLLCGQSN